MSLRVNTNLTALVVRRQLEASGQRLGGTIAKLSRGLRIVTAADDASGLGIAERMRARVRSFDVAARNAQDGQSMLQSAEGGLEEVSNNLIRMRELAVQALNGTLTQEQRTTLNVEFQDLKGEIERVVKLEFNGIQVLNNTTVYSFQVGVEARDAISVANVDARSVTLGIASNGVGTIKNANDSTVGLDAAIERVASYRGSRGAAIGRLESARKNAQGASGQLASAESRIRDLDMAMETSLLARDSILQQMGVALLAQANTGPGLALQLLA